MTSYQKLKEAYKQLELQLGWEKTTNKLLQGKILAWSQKYPDEDFNAFFNIRIETRGIFEYPVTPDDSTGQSPQVMPVIISSDNTRNKY